MDVVFTANACHLQDRLTKRVLPLGKLCHGLYYTLDKALIPTYAGRPTFPNTSAATVASKDLLQHAKLMHLRLGHMPFSRIKILLPSLDIKAVQDTFVCSICPLAKQTRLSFPSNHVKTTSLFDLLHVDVWGPYANKTHCGCSLFLTIVDDYSRNTWVYLMKSKEQSVHILQQLLVLIETQFGIRVKTIRTDNAPDLCAGPMLRFYQSKGIIHHRSCVGTPQQNGVVERKHRHLLETARALSFQSNLPSSFWGDIILCAAYLINRMPLVSLDNVSPYEKIFGHTPNNDHLRAFGCLCFVSTLKHGRSKFSPRADKCVFIGYPFGQKGYKVYHPKTKKVFVSRDVQFMEHHFPYHFPSPNDTPPTPPPFQFYLPTHNPPSSFYDTYTTPSPTPPTPTYSSCIPTTLPLSPITSHTPPTTLPTDPPNTLPPHPPPTLSTPSLRRSTRPQSKPSHLQDYYCNIVHYHDLPISHQLLLANHAQWHEPKSYKVASQDPQWVHAMQCELDALHQNNTWDLVPLPPHKKAIGSKWVFKVKLKADGSLERYKARLVAKGYTQEYGTDYQETFSPVVKMTTIRCIISVAAHRRWPLFQLDINNAFLHGDLHEEVYMLPPEGLSHPPNTVCKLKKSLYGLKQASRQWFAKLTLELLHHGFIQSKNDYSLFIRDSSGSFTLAAVYIDDIILTGNDTSFIDKIKAHLHRVFSIKDLGRMHFFLGLEVSYIPEGTVLSQRKFTKELLLESGITHFKRVATPLPVHLKLQSSTSPLLPNPTLYRSLVGKLNFLTHTRPDLSFSVQTLSQYMQNPTDQHFAALTHTLHYVAGTVGQRISLNGSNNLTLQAFSDFDWAACLDTRRSVTGYILMLGSSPISWKSKKQSTVSKSSSEAEYRALSSAASEITWLVRLLTELGVPNLAPVTLFCDNQSAIHLAHNPVQHERTKHISIDCHFTREKVLEGLLHLTYIPTQ